MKITKLLTPAFLVGMCCLTAAARAQVYYTISNGSSSTTTSGYADLQDVNIKIDGTTEANTFAGGIQITQDLADQGGKAVAGVPTQYTTICTDVSGTVYLTDTYKHSTPVSPFGTLSGVDPSWGAINGPGTNLLAVGGKANATQAIQNAAFLFYHFGNLTSAGVTETASLTLGSVADQMAGLQLAVWEALYDTQISGQVVVNSSSRFQVLAGGDATATADATGYLATLNSQLNAGKFGYAGSLLFPDPANPDNGSPYNNENYDDQPPQELLIATPVPEPSTILAGAMLLLPFSATTIRILRKNRRG